jgi:hypothetical protein
MEGTVRAKANGFYRCEPAADEISHCLKLKPEGNALASTLNTWRCLGVLL